MGSGTTIAIECIESTENDDDVTTTATTTATISTAIVTSSSTIPETAIAVCLDV